MAQTFIIIYKPGPAWIEGKTLSEQPLREHGKYIYHLYRSGAVRFAGPFTDDAGGAAVIKAAGEEEAREIMKNDPAVRDEVFIGEIIPGV